MPELFVVVTQYRKAMLEAELAFTDHFAARIQGLGRSEAADRTSSL